MRHNLAQGQATERSEADIAGYTRGVGVFVFQEGFDMKGRLVGLHILPTVSLYKQRLVIDLAEDFRQTFDALKGFDVSIEVKKFRKKRSLDANALAWLLIDRISEATGEDKTTVYRNAIKEIGGVSEMVCVQDEAVNRLCEIWESRGLGWQTDRLPSEIEGFTNVILYYGSSVYDTKQMSQLIDHLIQDARALGIETLPPEELARITSLLRDAPA